MREEGEEREVAAARAAAPLFPAGGNRGEVWGVRRGEEEEEEVVIPLFPAEETEEGSRRGEEEEKGKKEVRLRRW